MTAGYRCGERPRRGSTAGIGGASQVLIPISGNDENSAGNGGGCGLVRGLDIRIPFRQPELAAAAGHGGA